MLKVAVPYISVFLCCVSFVVAQPTRIVTKGNAPSILDRADVGFRGSNRVTDVQMRGTATSYAGSSRHSGPVTLAADNQGHGKIVYSFDDGTRIEYFSGSAEAAECEWTDADGKNHHTPAHNCLTLGNWFLPTLSYAAASIGKDLIYVPLGREQAHSVALAMGTPISEPSGVAGPVEHLRLKRTMSDRPDAVAQRLQELSAVELFLNLETLLPQLLQFAMHAEDDLNVNIPVAVQYLDYRDVSNVRIPFHIRRFVNGVLAIDIVISSAVINSGTQIQK